MGIRAASVAVVLALWELHGRRVDPLLFAHPSAIVRAGVDLVVEGMLLGPLTSSLAALGAGLAASVAAGVGLGLAMGRSRLAGAALDPIVTALYATPPVALVPLLMVWLGVDFAVKVVLVFLFAIFPVLIATASGVKAVNESLVDVGRVHSASRWQILARIVLPAALPFIMAGVRVATGRALVGMIVGELFTAVTGLGGLLTLYGNLFETAHLLAVVLLVGAIGVGLGQAARGVESRLARWKATERAVQ